MGPTGEQIFEATISADQAALIPRDAVFRVMFDNSTWSAVVSASRVDEYDNTVLVLAGEGGGPVCADACGTLPGDEKATLRAEAIIVPEVTGATIPAAAIRTDTDGNQYVTLADNTTVSVSVMASAQGLVVVEGLRLGQVVLIYEPKPSEIAPASEADPTAAGASTGEAH